MFYIGTRPQANGRNFIHRKDCPLLPSPGNRIFLGTYESPEDAVEEGKKYFDNPDTCRFCMHHAETERSKFAEAIEEPGFLTHAGIINSWESALACGVN